MTANDLFRKVDHFPLGRPMVASGRDDAVTPFGLRYATMPSEAATFEPDFSKISYDLETQTAIFTEDDGSVIQAAKHTSTKTTTTTASQDRKGDDKDSDATGD
jgi:putative ATP-grasp target RiPP